MDASRARGLILCVDDYENILEGWELLLKSVGYQVLTARNGASALELFTSHSVDEVILDYQLAETTGDVVANEMKVIKPNVPILLLSGNGELSQEKLLAVDRFLPKGGSTAIFLATIEALLSSTRQTLHTAAISDRENQKDQPIANGLLPTTQPKAA